MNLIEELGVEKCQAIVDGAPSNTNYKYYSLDLGVGAAGWHCDYRDGCFALSDLRAAIADHNRTDYVSDIRNHIAPTTVVIYRHNKTGNLYSYIATANKCNNEKFPKMAVYQSLSDGNIYSRPYKDFFNAFTALRGEHEQ